MDIVEYEMTIKEIIPEAENTYTFTFDIPEGVEWSAGTNIHVAFGDFKEDGEINKEKVRHFSVMSHMDEGILGFTTRLRKTASPFKERLKTLKPGDILTIYKFDNRIRLERDGSRIILISMGVGLAAVREFILEYCRDNNSIPELVNINIDKPEFRLFENELNKIEKAGFSYTYVSSRGDLYDRINETFEKEKSHYYVIGSDDFIEEIAAFLLDNSVKKEHIHLDKKPEKKIEIFEPSISNKK